MFYVQETVLNIILWFCLNNATKLFMNSMKFVHYYRNKFFKIKNFTNKNKRKKMKLSIYSPSQTCMVVFPNLESFQTKFITYV